MKHGLRAFETSGRLPAGCEYIAEAVGALRTELTDDVKQRHKSVSLTHESTIDRACRHETKRLLLERWFYLQCGTGEGADIPATITTTTTKTERPDGAKVETTKRAGMDLSERADLLDRITKAADARDKAVRDLDLQPTEGAGKFDGVFE